MKTSKRVWAGRIITAIVGLFFAFNVAVKLFPQVFYPDMIAQMAKIGLPESILTTVAFLEALCVTVYLIPITSVAGAVLFTGYLGGAMLAHLRVGEGVSTHVIFIGIIWLGIYLREPRLQAVLPFRKNS